MSTPSFDDLSPRERRRMIELHKLGDQAAALADHPEEPRILYMAACRARSLHRTVQKDDLLWAKRVARATGAWLA